MLSRSRLVCLFSFVSVFQQAQINGFAKVTAISGSVLTLININQTSGTFSVGDQVIIMQMQGASISNTTNTSSFGTLGSLNSAGLYEAATVTGFNSAAGSMTLAATLLNSYDVNGQVQVITFPQLGTAAYTTTGNILATAWNATTGIGGVIAFHVNGNLNLAHAIRANGAGFRGGLRAQNDGGSCETSTFITSNGNAKYAEKGHGVYIVAAGERAGRGRAVNGGGGAIVHNGGGGGGGNFSAGGNGYFGYTGSGYCSSTTNAGGLGGSALSSSGTRVFMGGGGGGGQGNNSVAGSGGNGGGIILLRCDTIVLDGTCGILDIRANGQLGGNSSANDGAGGAGAGGTIVLEIRGIRVETGCELIITANGENGGSVGNNDTHGSGGGGGMGAIFVHANGPFANTSFSTNFGIGGAANSTSSAPTASSGGGPSNIGVNYGVTTTLPVEWYSAHVIGSLEGGAIVQWKTALERNTSHFEVYHTVNGTGWYYLGSRQAHGESISINAYQHLHRTPLEGLNYYRIKQIDKAGRYAWSPVLLFEHKSRTRTNTVYPNPGTGLFTLVSETLKDPSSLVLSDLLGHRRSFRWHFQGDHLIIDLRDLPDGIYLLRSGTETEKIVLRRL